jgi:hypothetical protein
VNEDKRRREQNPSRGDKEAAHLQKKGRKICKIKEKKAFFDFVSLYN